MCVHKWAEIISEHVTNMHTFLNPIVILHLKDYIVPCNETNNQVNYEKMTKSFNSNSDIYDFLKNAFKFIDFDQNGEISYEEATRAIKIINKKLGTDYDTNFISQLDTVNILL